MPRTSVKGCLITVLIWFVIISLPVAIEMITPLQHSLLGPLAFIPALYWINIPGMPLARIWGLPHFKMGEFGALPQDVFAWTLITLFWILVAVCLALITHLALRFWKKTTTTQPSGKHTGDLRSD